MANSSRNRSGAASRFRRHQSSIVRICASASGGSRLAGSPAAAQLVENRRCWLQLARFRGLPGFSQSFVQRAALVVREIVTLIVGDEVDNRSFGQARRLVEDEPPLFDSRSEWGHVATVRVSCRPGKGSGWTTTGASSQAAFRSDRSNSPEKRRALPLGDAIRWREIAAQYSPEHCCASEGEAIGFEPLNEHVLEHLAPLLTVVSQQALPIGQSILDPRAGLQRIERALLSLQPGMREDGLPIPEPTNG